LIVPVYLRKYTPPWVYCRCIYHGIEAAQRNRAYDVAVEWLTFLLQKEGKNLKKIPHWQFFFRVQKLLYEFPRHLVP
jgi:hypothetical protein